MKRPIRQTIARTIDLFLDSKVDPGRTQLCCRCGIEGLWISQHWCRTRGVGSENWDQIRNPRRTMVFRKGLDARTQRNP